MYGQLLFRSFLLLNLNAVEEWIAKGKEVLVNLDETCNEGPSPVPRPKALPEGWLILHSHNYTLTINNNYPTHYCSHTIIEIKVLPCGSTTRLVVLTCFLQ